MNYKDFEQFLIIRKGAALATTTKSVWCLRNFLRWLEEQPFTKDSVEKFFMLLHSQQKAPNTLNGYRTTLLYYQEYLNDRGENIHFMEEFKSYSKERIKQIDILTLEEMNRLLVTKVPHGKLHGKDMSFMDTVYLLLTKFLLFTGVRISGAVNLKVGEIDFATGQALIHLKGSRLQKINLEEPLLSELKAFVGDKKKEEYVFTTSIGTRVYLQAFWKDLRERAKLAGITKNVHPHMLRHSFASHLRMNGVDIADIATLLGHKSISTTFVNYIQYFDMTLKKALHKLPYIRSGVPPKEILQIISNTIREFSLDNDERFKYTLEETQDGISLKVIII